MITMTEFFIWFFEGLRGVGGWLVFLIISLVSIIYVFTNSSNRALPASKWRLAVVMVSFLVLPAAILKFLPANLQQQLLPYKEIIFYVGMVGGVIPFMVAIGYSLRFSGMIVCEKGHLYNKKMGECPACIPEDFVDYDPSELDETQLDLVVETTVDETDPFADLPLDETDAGALDDATEAELEKTEVADREFFETQTGRVGLPKKVVPKANGFLLFPGGQSCQLNQGNTTIGRGSRNDCVLQNTFISRDHAKIVEESRNLFRIYDLGSANGTWLNGRKLMKATLLENDDTIRFGEEVSVVFLSSRKI